MPLSHADSAASRPRWRSPCATLLCAALAAGAQAQLFDPVDWTEIAVGPAPAFDLQRLVEFEGPGGSALRWGIDPASVTIGSDRVIRYVVVARSTSGALNAMHEGIRCSKGQLKTYARWSQSSGWRPVADADWQSLFGSRQAQHALQLARGGLCDAAAPANSAEQAIRQLKRARTFED